MASCATSPEGTYGLPAGAGASDVSLHIPASAGAGTAATLDFSGTTGGHGVEGCVVVSESFTDAGAGSHATATVGGYTFTYDTSVSQVTVRRADGAALGSVPLLLRCKSNERSFQNKCGGLYQFDEAGPVNSAGVLGDALKQGWADFASSPALDWRKNSGPSTIAYTGALKATIVGNKGKQIKQSTAWAARSTSSARRWTATSSTARWRGASAPRARSWAASAAPARA
jgi:hypothetical protein